MSNDARTMKPNLGILDPHEWLWIWRKQQGLTQARAAKRFRVWRGIYIACERGERAITNPMTEHANATSKKDVGAPMQLALARRRAGRTLRATAKKVGVSHRTLLKWEKTASPRLVNYWEKAGFTFVGVLG